MAAAMFGALRIQTCRLPWISTTAARSRPSRTRRKTSTRASASPPTSSSSSSTSLSTERQRQQVELYVDALLEWNVKVNLTARSVTEREEVMGRHVGDSLALLPVIDQAIQQGKTQSSNIRVIDVGSGAGLPGLILAIVRPDWAFTLLEAHRKRCTFMEHVVKEAQLPNVEVHWSRAEEAGREPKRREAYDLSVARAVADLRVLAELCLPFVRVGGSFIAAKGPNPQASSHTEEVEQARTAVKLLGGDIVSTQLVDSSGAHGQRTAVICIKKKPTPVAYPRLPGVPKQKPL
eukprot:jgi/Chlat1/2574/Chrsp175S02403